METAIDIFSYAALASIFIPLIALLVAYNISIFREIKEHDEIEKLKKSGKGTAPAS